MATNALTSFGSGERLSQSPPSHETQEPVEAKAKGSEPEWNSTASPDGFASDLSMAPIAGMSPAQGSTAMTTPGVSAFGTSTDALSPQEPESAPEPSRQPTIAPPRPQNAWLLYRNDRLSLLSEKDSKRPQGELSKAIAAAWKSEPKEVKKAYEDAARQRKEEHKLKYPDYKYAPRRREGDLPLPRVSKRRKAKKPEVAAEPSERRRPTSAGPAVAPKPSTVPLKQTRRRSRTVPINAVQVQPFGSTPDLVLSPPTRSLPAPLMIPPLHAGPSSAPATYAALPRDVHELAWPSTASDAYSGHSASPFYGPNSPTGTGLSALIAAESSGSSLDPHRSPLFGGVDDHFVMEEQKPVIQLDPALAYSLAGESSIDPSYSFPGPPRRHMLAPASAPSQHSTFDHPFPSSEHVPHSAPLLHPTPLAMHQQGLSFGNEYQYRSGRQISPTSPYTAPSPGSGSEPEWWQYRHVRVREDREGMELQDLIHQLHDETVRGGGPTY